MARMQRWPAADGVIDDGPDCGAHGFAVALPLHAAVGAGRCTSSRTAVLNDSLKLLVCSILALVIAVAVTMTCLLDAFCVVVLMMSTVECIVDEIYFHIVQANVAAGMPDPCAGAGASPNSVPLHQSMDSTERLSYFTYRRCIFSECATYIRDERNSLFKAMMAAVVYGSNIGSSGTSRGSQQSYYLLHFLRQTYKGATTLNYVTWTAYSAPSVVASAVFLWWHLCRRWVPRALQSTAWNHDDTDVRHVKYAAIRRLEHKSYETVAIILMVAYVNCSLIGQDLD
ncbi:hypothetical protein MTO96_010427 [Rhipicephalus appendiculatus]